MLNNITAVIKTFFRYEFVEECLQRIHKIAPEIQVIIIDDTPFQYRRLINHNYDNVIQVTTKEDIGLCAGRNLGYKLANTEYIWNLDDSQVPDMTREELIESFNYVKHNVCDFIGGRSANITPQPEGVYVCNNFAANKIQQVDITDNFFITKKALLLEFPFIESIKIQGDHFIFFYILKENKKIVFTSPSMKFKEASTFIQCENIDEYRKYRGRSFVHEVYNKYPEIKSFRWVTDPNYIPPS